MVFLWASQTLAQRVFLPNSEPVLPEVIVDAEVFFDEKLERSQIRGELTIIPQGIGRDTCLYLPYNDAEYGHDRGTARRLEQFQGKTPKAAFQGGESQKLKSCRDTPCKKLDLFPSLIDSRGVARFE